MSMFGDIIDGCKEENAQLKDRIAKLEAMLLLCSRHTGNEADCVTDVPEIIRLREEGKRNVIVSQDAEIARLKTELQNWMETAMAASQEGCGDEVHCTCVGPLRELVYLRGEELAQRDEEIARLKAELEGG